MAKSLFWAFRTNKAKVAALEKELATTKGHLDSQHLTNMKLRGDIVRLTNDLRDAEAIKLSVQIENAEIRREVKSLRDVNKGLLKELDAAQKRADDCRKLLKLYKGGDDVQ